VAGEAEPADPRNDLSRGVTIGAQRGDPIAPACTMHAGSVKELLARLEQAGLTIEAALAEFQKGLSDQQNIHFNALQLASRR